MASVTQFTARVVDNVETVIVGKRQQIELLRPGGGFVFQQVHNIMADVPPRNIVAMYDAVRGSVGG